MPGQHAPYYILINLDIEDQGDLVGDALLTEAGVSAFHLDDCRNEFRRWSDGTWLTTIFRREQPGVLPFHQRSMGAENGGGLKDDG